MPCWLLLLNDAGFPLFSRSYGLPSSAFSFPTMGLLSALHSTACNSGFGVTRLEAHDATLLFRIFTGGLIIVFATSDTHMEETAIDARIQHIYDALVFLLGRHKVQDLRNVERTKRQIRTCAGLLSLFLVEDAHHLLQMGTGVPECCIPSNVGMFEHIRTLAAACNTLHACFYAQHRQYAWTSEWAELDSRDLFTIATFLRSSTPAQARDVPVYLAHSSLGGGAAQSQATGRTPYRLLTIALVHDFELVLLCGPAPALVDALAIVQKTITGLPTLPAMSAKPQLLAPMHVDLLASAADFPRHLPHTFSFHLGILGFLFIHSHDASGVAPLRHRERMVASFLPTAPNLPTVVDSDPKENGKKGRRSPSPIRRKGSKDAGANEPFSPAASGQFAPSNPLFSSSLLSEATVLTRSHALLGFYHLVREELALPPVTALANAASPSSGASASAASAVASAPVVTEAYMLTANRGFYACRRGAHTLYVMYGEKVSQLHHGPLAWQLMEKLEALPHHL